LVGIALAASGILTGCTGVPVDGPVLSSDRPGLAQNGGDIAVKAQGPAQGAKPASIIDGFLVAMAEYQPGYTTARQFLTEPASASWRPGTVHIYADLAGLTMTSDSTARINAQLVGQLDRGGVYTAVGGSAMSLDFGLDLNEQGEWRISSLPADLGVVVTRARFNSAYQRLDTYYFDDQGQVLLPDTRYLPRGRWLRQLIEALLAGPSSRVAAIADASLVTTVTLDETTDLGFEAGVVTIPLAPNGAPRGLFDTTRLAIQCAATLRQIAGVEAVRLTVGGQPLAVEGQAADGSLALTEVSRFDPFVRSAAAVSLLAIQDSLVVRLAGRAWLGDLGTTARAMSALAVASNLAGQADRIAVVTPTGLTLGPGSGELPEVLVASDLIRPQFDRQGWLWAFAPTETGSQVWLVTRESVDQLSAPALTGRIVRAVRIAPDGRRVALVVEAMVGGQAEAPPEPRRLGLAQVRLGVDGRVWLDGWRDLPVVVDGAELGAIADVAWVGPSTLNVLGTTVGSEANAVYSLRLDGVEPPEAIGRPDERALVSLTTVPGDGSLIVLDATGEAHRWLDAHAWESLGSGLTAIAYAT